MIRRREEENETSCARSFLLDDALFWNFKRVSNAGSLTCLATRRRSKISWTTSSSLAGLESLVPEELGEKSDPQLESLGNIRRCAPGSRDVRGGEVRSESS